MAVKGLCSQRPQEGEPVLLALLLVCGALSPFPGAKSLCPASLATATVVSWGQEATGRGEGQLLRQKAQLGQRSSFSHSLEAERTRGGDLAGLAVDGVEV